MKRILRFITDILQLFFGLALGVIVCLCAVGVAVSLVEHREDKKAFEAKLSLLSPQDQHMVALCGTAPLANNKNACQYVNSAKWCGYITAHPYLYHYKPTCLPAKKTTNINKG